MTRTPRAVCSRCRRPETVCYCEHVTRVETASRIVILQHPRESDVAIGTARMASLCLASAELHVGIHWSGTAALERALSDPNRPAVLLYPAAGAIDVMRTPPTTPVTLIVLDGTWSQTRKLLRRNPELAALPRYAFSPPAPSEYRIRKEPDEHCVSTIEALAHVLGALSREPERCRALLQPFRAMVDAQLACAGRLHHARRRDRPPRPPRPPAHAWLSDRVDDLVCVVGEANAWPCPRPGQPPGYADELVHWTAHRLATGDTFDVVLAPRNPLSPRTPVHLDLVPDALRAGCSVASFVDRWGAFVRDTDVICSWGHYGASLFAALGGRLPATRADIRQLARAAAGRRVGTAEACHAALDRATPPRLARGRAGLRLALLAGITRTLVAPGTHRWA